MPTIAEDVLHAIERMSARDQQRALDLVRLLSRQTSSEPPLQESTRPVGTPIEALLAMAGTLDDQSAQEMRLAIEEGCEQIDPQDWH